jgi:2-polyprenyl-6-methoxyphenol hydroxylase-like FAD-dependent oxidoreductase
LTLTHLSTRCCIVGAGPCGLMLGLLLARAGVDVIVLEKHADFLRDFRGDSIHPSTLEVMSELDLLDKLLKLPHQKELTQSAYFSGREYPFADFTRLPTRCKFIALMPQWDFLNFLAEHGKNYPSFRLLMRAEAVEVREESGRVAGVSASTPDGPIEVRADLTVACDGRYSVIRARAGLIARDLGAPMDILWFRLRKTSVDPAKSFARFDAGRILVAIARDDYWQCAFHIAKGSLDQIRRNGLPAFRQNLARLVPEFTDRLKELEGWEQIKLLAVTLDRLDRWHRPGLLCIGDAAHAMSPLGGVGVNLAIQDAVAAANILWEPLQSGMVQSDHLRRVQKRRMFPTRATQRLQAFLHNRLIHPVLSGSTSPKAPPLLQLMGRFASLRRVEARLIALGFRPEHVRTPDHTAETISMLRSSCS